MREAFVCCRRTDAAGHVHVAVDRVVPKGIEGCHVVGVADIRCHIGHTAEEVHGTHGMAAYLPQVLDGHGVLIVVLVPVVAAVPL